MKKLLSILLFSFLASHALDNPSVPNAFSSGNTILASEFNDNYDSLVQWGIRTNDSLDAKFIRFTDFDSGDSTLGRIQADTVIITDQFIFNEAAAADRDARMEGDTEVNLFFLDGSTDRIGIGTATPATLLDVNGVITATSLTGNLTGNVTGEITSDGANILDTITTESLTATANVSFDGGTFIFNEAGADLDARFEGDTKPNLITLDAGTDRVGIGRVPSALFHIADDAGTIPSLDASTFFVISNSSTTSDAVFVSIVAGNTGTSAICFSDTDLEAPGQLSYNHNIDRMTFRTNDVSRMHIISSGFVGIAEQNPGAALEVNGTINTDSLYVSGDLEVVGNIVADSMFLTKSLTTDLTGNVTSDGSSTLDTIVTELATLTRNETSGFSQFGSSGPIMQMKFLTDSTGSSEGDITFITHGLSGGSAEVIACNVLIKAATGTTWHPQAVTGTSASEVEYYFTVANTSVNIFLHATNSGAVTDALIRVVLWYQE